MSGYLAATPSWTDERRIALVEWAAPPPREVQADANGKAEVRYPQVGPGLTWAVERITVSCQPSAPGTEFRWYAGEPYARNFVDGTSEGDLDVAEYPAPVLVGSGLAVVGVWTGAPANAQCWLRLQYRVLRMT